MFVGVCDKIGSKTKECFASMETLEIMNTNVFILYHWSFIVEKRFFCCEKASSLKERHHSNVLQCSYLLQHHFNFLKYLCRHTLKIEW